jgi:nucleoside 2-deoxyribosyltransferase
MERGDDPAISGGHTGTGGGLDKHATLWTSIAVRLLLANGRKPMDKRRLKAYLAGPEVFLPDAVAIGQRKKELCDRYGFEGLYPFDNEVSPDSSGTRIDLLIYRANVTMMHEADFGILNLTSFRGPSADVGTVFELGMLAGLAKPVFAHTNDDEDFLARVKRTEAAQYDPVAKAWRDSAGMTIENFGNVDNLMIDATLVQQGRSIVRRARTGEARFRDLTGFEECLRLAAATLSPMT